MPHFRTSTKTSETLATIVDDSLRSLVDDGKVAGMAVGAVSTDRSFVFGVGTTSREQGHVPNGSTVFEIGSISKTFTGLLLADMVERGEVSLDDPIQKYLPEGCTAPSRNGKEITLRLLATHASGLPRLPSNIKLNPRDPYKDYTEADLLSFVASHKLRRDPGERAEYSNLGMGLLGWLLTRKAGAPSYEQLVIDRIAGPLGMDETRITLTDSMRERMAQGYNRAGLKSSNWTIETLADAGGLRSTVNDMCRFVAAFLTPDSTPLARAVRLCTTPQRDFDRPDTKIGLAWILLKDGTTFHNGETGGYHSYIGIRSSGSIGVVILANTATSRVDQAGLALTERLAKSGILQASR